MQLHIHGADSDEQGEHVHTGSTSNQGAHNHTGVTGAAGAHNHDHDGFSRLLKPPYVGSLTGTDEDGSGTEQAVGSGDSADIAGVQDHGHSIPEDGLHSHDVIVTAAGKHKHNITIASAGVTETRQRGTNYPYIMRVL